MKKLFYSLVILFLSLTYVQPMTVSANWDDFPTFYWKAYLDAPLNFSLDLCGVCTEDGTPDPTYCDLNLTVPPSGFINAYTNGSTVATFAGVMDPTTEPGGLNFTPQYDKVLVTYHETNQYYQSGAGQNPGTYKYADVTVTISPTDLVNLMDAQLTILVNNGTITTEQRAEIENMISTTGGLTHTMENVQLKLTITSNGGTVSTISHPLDTIGNYTFTETFNSCTCLPSDWVDTDGDGVADGCCPALTTPIDHDSNASTPDICEDDCQLDGLCGEECGQTYCADGTVCDSHADCSSTGGTGGPETTNAGCYGGPNGVCDTERNESAINCRSDCGSTDPNDSGFTAHTSSFDSNQYNNGGGNTNGGDHTTDTYCYARPQFDPIRCETVVLCPDGVPDVDCDTCPDERKYDDNGDGIEEACCVEGQLGRDTDGDGIFDSCTSMNSGCYGDVTCEGWNFHFGHTIPHPMEMEIYDETTGVLVGSASVPVSNNPFTNVSGPWITPPTPGGAVVFHIIMTDGTRMVTMQMPEECQTDCTVPTGYCNDNYTKSCSTSDDCGGTTCVYFCTEPDGTINRGDECAIGDTNGLPSMSLPVGHENGTCIAPTSCGACSQAYCGDGKIDSGEECDDGNNTAGDGCNATCWDEFCGDGYLDENGPDNITGTADDEKCDDGNQVNNDGCSSSCEQEGPSCGNGVLETGEQCDDGNTVNGDGCSANCTWESNTDPVCGNGVLELGEQCDDGNKVNGDGCSEYCQLEPYCGDGNVDTGEQCDDGNTNDTDACPNDCVYAECGDGVWEGTEECDDGNTEDGDGCSNDCLLEQGSFDLALMKTINNATSGPFEAGDLVLFDITVYNQGTIDATNIKVEDVVPTGMSFDSSADFSHTNGDLIAVINSLSAGADVTLSVMLRIDPTFSGDQIINVAEITSADGGVDEDDAYDQCSDDAIDAGEVDDDINDNPDTASDVDSCDHVIIPVDNDTGGGDDDFDLALVKTIDSTANTYSAGDEVTFKFVVHNQGDLKATNIEVVDYVPTGMSFVSSSGAYPFVDNGNGTLTALVDQLSKGNTAELFVTLKIDAGFSGTQIINVAEIIAADGGDDIDNPLRAYCKADSILNDIGNGYTEIDDQISQATEIDTDVDSCDHAVINLGGGGCTGGDADGDGVLDSCDICNKGDDNVDTNNNGRPDACENTTGGDNYCGDGDIKRNEQCDDGANNGTSSSECTKNCKLKRCPGGGCGVVSCDQPPNALWYARHCEEANGTPKCAYIDPPAIQLGEYLPFRWELEQDVNVQLTDTCDAGNVGAIMQDSMMCKFFIENGSSAISTFTLPCSAANPAQAWYKTFLGTNVSPQAFILPLFQDAMPLDEWTIYGGSTLPKGYITIDESIVQDDQGNNTFGEYHLSLEYIDYQTCDGVDVDGNPIISSKKTTDDRICSMNFTVSDGFMSQKTVLNTETNTDLSFYKDVSGASVVNSSLYETNLVHGSAVTYNGKSVKDVADEFIDTYGINAVVEVAAGDLPFYVEDSYLTMKKVPNEEIYVYDGVASKVPYLVISEKETDKAYTLLVKNTNLAVKGSMDTNGLYVVRDGEIVFHTEECDDTHTVAGLFISGEGFATSVIRNNDLRRANWCDDGRMVLEGQILGNMANTSGTESDVGTRSVLKDWFNGNTSTQDDVFSSAALRIETNADLWTSGVPGINFFSDKITTKKE